MTMKADVIMVALHAAEPLPLSFYVWAEAWLPHRFPAAGSLVALIDLPERPNTGSDGPREYLAALAKQGHRDFLVEERKLQPAAGTVQDEDAKGLTGSRIDSLMPER